LHGWKAGENSRSFRVVDGQIAVGGPRSHLFYTGRARNASFKNFELRAEVMPRAGAESGIYFHTTFQPKGWPDKGFKVQINNTYPGEGDYRERNKTGSLYGVRNVYKALTKDNEWSQLHVLVRAKQVQVRLNDTLLVDYLEPDPPVVEADYPGRVLGRGTFALECHDANSKVLFRNIQVKPLPDDLPADAAEPPVVDAVYRDLQWMQAQNIPVLDCHVHLKGGLTLEEALANSRRAGIQYGIAINGGLNFPTTTDAAAEDYLRSMKGQPCFVALQGEGREWVTLFSKETAAKFDYVFTDAMTFTDDSGKRMRIWIKEEVGEIKDAERFMDMLVDRAVGILDHEAIDIHANPTVLPDALAADYDRLWTPERMQRLIDAAKRNDVAIEINNRYKVPSAAFIKAAKKAGVKFSFGTNNGDKNLGRDEYGVQMVKECGLTGQDMFLPKPDGEKAVQKRGVLKSSDK
jgi:histidinol phosphatase-like PHP family hydrolase